jgi:hypothetical protein
MCSYKAGGARYIQHYTSDERYDHEYMNFLEMLLFRAVDFRLRPTAIFEGFQLSSPLGGETATEMMARSWESPGMQLEISIGDPELGISVQVLEIFDPWQYEQRDPDTPVDWKRFKPRDSIRFAHERNFLVSVTTLLEHTVYQHWAVRNPAFVPVRAPGAYPWGTGARGGGVCGEGTDHDGSEPAAEDDTGYERLAHERIPPPALTAS